MDDLLHLTFKGLARPVTLTGCAELLPAIKAVLPGWPCDMSHAAATAESCFTIRSASRPGHYVSAAMEAGFRENTYDAVDTVCDMIVELSWEMLRSSERLLCLHGAAIAIGGRMVILPNVRRAGKSTLTACLARRGHSVFSDDFVPVGLGGDGLLGGMATGVCPRLRLPLPEEFSQALKSWVADNPGPGNRRYKYLGLSTQPRHGQSLPLGAVVILDRDTAAPDRPAVLEPMQRDAALDALLHQNFARAVHSGTILGTLTALLEQAPPYRLRYGSAEVAAALIEDHFRAWPEPGSRTAVADLPDLRLAALGDEVPPAPAFDPRRAYRRRAGFAEALVDGSHYVTDAGGLAVHRLNDGARAIWAVLAEPATAEEVASLLIEAFGAPDPAAVSADCAATLELFARHRLIEAI